MDVFLFFCIILISSNVNGGLLDNRQKRSDDSTATDVTDDTDDTDDVEYVVVETVNGKLRGKVFPAVGTDGKVAHFLGIPYAEKPIGEHRFKNPLPKENWEGTRDSFNHGSPCQQFYDVSLFEDYPSIEMWMHPVPLNEDCLFLNVWVPYPIPKNSTVMVWIHGGGFMSGASSAPFYNGEILAGHTDVIVVSLNYRLGSFGFLASGDDRIKGNFGLKDQLLALKWIKNNIGRFGGNPTSITLFGQSSGASSVGFHLISPLSANLFQRVIMQSGSPNSHFSFTSNDWAKLHFKKLLSRVNCTDDENVLSCLQQAPVYELNKYLMESWKFEEVFQPAFLPVIDGDFLKENPNYSIDKNEFKKVPTLLSVTKNEGTVFLIFYLPKFFNLKNESCLSRNEFYQITDQMCKDLSPNTREIIKYLYTDWTDSTSPTKNRDAIGDILGDKVVGCKIHHFAEIVKEYNPDVYLAEFNYRASKEDMPEWAGVYHSADIQFLFGHPFKTLSRYSEKDRTVSHQVMTFWSNFAKFGNPNGDPAKISSSDVSIQWPALHHKHQHLEIADELKIGQHLKDDKCQFWNVVVPALNRLSCSTN